MDKTLRNALIGGIIVLAIVISYYFVYRPLRLENIKKTCVQKGLEQAKEKVKEPPVNRETTTGWHRVDQGIKPEQGYYDNDYRKFLDRCLQENGVLN